jgi:endonuclease/exonuclease/phosphatase family metal-dependent hydrolase
VSAGRRFTPGRIGLFILVVAVMFTVDGSRKVPAPPASGTSLNGRAATTEPATNLSDNSSDAVLRVAAYNIAGGVGKADDRLDLDRTAAALKGFDLIGLEEVHGSLTGPDQAQILGEKLDHAWLFAPVESQWWHEAFGDGILTNLSVTHWQRIPLANDIADSNRELLWTELEFNGRPINVLITHLERHADREAELKTAISLFESLQSPVILMGDLNTGKDDPQMVELRKRPDVNDPIYGALDEKYHDSVDWILLRGLKSAHAGFTDNGASDHPLVWADLQFSDVK